MVVPVASNTTPLDTFCVVKTEVSATSNKVNAEECMWCIARRYGLSAQELAELNDIDSRAALRPGQKLLVAGTLTVAHTSLIDTRRKIVYTVRKGDTLARVSKRYDVSVQQLRKWNKLNKKTSRLRAGRQLTVYVDMLADVKP